MALNGRISEWSGTPWKASLPKTGRRRETCVHSTRLGFCRLLQNQTGDAMGGALVGARFAEAGNDPAEPFLHQRAFLWVAQKLDGRLGNVLRRGGLLDKFGNDFLIGQQVGHGK